MITRSVVRISHLFADLPNFTRKAVTGLPRSMIRNVSQQIKKSGRATGQQTHRYMSTRTVMESKEKLKIYEDHARGSITVAWNDGTESEYANIFLRDQCRCPQCYNSNSNSRLLEPYTLPLDITPNNTVVDEVDRSLRVSWSDGHKSTYSFDFLKNVNSQSRLDDDVRYMNPILWKAERFQRNGFPTYAMSDVIGNEESMLDWFIDLKRIGATVLTGAGDKLGALDTIKEKLFGGYFKSTHYG